MKPQNDSRLSLLEMYAAGPDKLEAFIEGLPDDSLSNHPGGGEWSIREIIHHIVDGDDIWNTCIKAAMGNQDGEFTLQWYWDLPQLTWSKNWKYGTRSIKNSLALFRANRAHIVELLRLSPDTWDRAIAIHWPGDEGLSKVSIEDVVRMHVDHLNGHLDDMSGI